MNNSKKKKTKVLFNKILVSLWYLLTNKKINTFKRRNKKEKKEKRKTYNISF